MSEQYKNKSDFWLRSSWSLSSTCNVTFGQFLVTYGKYHGESGKYQSNVPYVLVLSGIQPDQDPNKSNLPLTKEGKLPIGFAFSVRQWSDFKQAFALFYMYKESACEDEVKLMFGLDENWLKQGKLYNDTQKDNFKEPAIDDDKVTASLEKSEILAACLNDWEPTITIESPADMIANLFRGRKAPAKKDDEDKLSPEDFGDPEAGSSGINKKKRRKKSARDKEEGEVITDTEDEEDETDVAAILPTPPFQKKVKVYDWFCFITCL